MCNGSVMLLLDIKGNMYNVQVFQEKISDEAKNLRAEKAIKAKKFVDRLLTIQKDVQESITELDRTRFTYHTEESEKLKVANQAEEADLKAKGLACILSYHTKQIISFKRQEADNDEYVSIKDCFGKAGGQIEC